MSEEWQGRCPAVGRHRPLQPPILATAALLVAAILAACGPLPSPSSPSGTPPPSSPAPASGSPTHTTPPSLSPVPPDERLVVLARSDTGSRLFTWRAGERVDLRLPGPDAHGLAIDRMGRAAVVAGGEVFVADGLAGTDVRWSPVAEFRPDPGATITGLAWSPDGALAWAGARELAGPSFTVVAGLIGGVLVRVEVDAGLDGAPVWLDTDRVGVLAVRDPTELLAVVSTKAARVTLSPFEASEIAATNELGLAAVGARATARVELRRLEDLTGTTEPIAVIDGPDASIVGSLAFSTEGRFLAVTWFGDETPRVSVYERSSGWQEKASLGLADLGLEGPLTAIEVAWRP